jgi:hypothetical protein
MVEDAGIASCVDAKSGEPVWTERIGGEFSASALYSGGHIYFFDQEGTTTVLRPARQFEQAASNKLDDGSMASPAVAGNALILRTRSHLYRIEE